MRNATMPVIKNAIKIAYCATNYIPFEPCCRIQ